MDAIVQDWFWWQHGGEGDLVVNEQYPDVPAELKTLHDEHVHAMISVWGGMDPTSKNLQEIKRRGLEIGERHRIEGASLEMQKCRSTVLVRSTLGDGRDLSRLAEFRVIVHSIDADLRNGRRGRECIGKWCVVSCVLPRNTIDGSFQLEIPSALCPNSA